MSRLDELERQNSGSRSAETDLRNVLAGFHVKDDTQPKAAAVRKTGVAAPVQLNDLHALPLNHGNFGATDVVLDQYKNLYEDRLTGPNGLPNIRMNIGGFHQNLHNGIQNLTISDTADLVEIHNQLRQHHLRDPANQGRPSQAKKKADKQFDRILEYVTLKERIQFEADSPARFESRDNPDQLKWKAEAKNKAFKAQVQRHKQDIFRGINRGHLNHSLPINSSAIEDTATYTSKVFSAAAKFEGEFKVQQAQAAQLAQDANSTIAHVSPEQALNRLTAQKEQHEEQLRVDVIEKATAGPQRVALEWKLKEMQLQAKYNRNPNQANRDALNQHNAAHDPATNPGGRPADYDTHYPDIRTHLQTARPIIHKIAAVEQQQEAVAPNQLAYDVAKKENEMEALEGQLMEHALNAHMTQYQTVTNPNATQEEIQQEYDTTKQQYSQLIRTNGDQRHQGLAVMPLPFPVVDPQANEKLNQIGELNAFVVANKHRVQDQPAYKLAAANFKYAGEMADLKYKLEQGNNPHPEALSNIQSRMDMTRAEHEKTVRDIHKEVGSLGLLERVSAPLNAVREQPNNISGEIYEGAQALPKFMRPGRDKRPVGSFNQKSARLPVLQTEDYQLKKIPQSLKNLKITTESVNALLEQRELLERQLEANPEIAKSANFREEFAKNDRQLKEQMKELTKLTNRNERYLRAHPEVAEFAQKALRLEDAVNRQSFHQRHKTLNKLAGLSAQSNNANPFARALGTAGQRTGYVQGIDPNIRFDPNAGKKLENTTTFTKFYVQEDLFKWKAKDLKENIKHRNADGSEYEVAEDVQFDQAELMEHFEDFCAKHDIRDRVKISNSGDNVTIKWPKESAREPTGYRDKWLSYLKDKYKEKRAEELNVPQHQAEVDVDRGAARGGIHGAPPMRMGGGGP